MNKATKQLLEENNRRGEQLTPENQKILVDIVAYLRGSSASTYQQELVHRDILDMLQEGEARGQTAPQVIGEDYQTFCDEILAELPRRSARERTIYGLSVVSLSAAVLVVIWLGFSLFTAVIQGPFTLWLPVKLGQLLGGTLIIAFSYGLVEYVCRTSFEDRSPTKVQVFGIFVGMVLFFLICMLLRQTLFSLHAGIAAVLAVVLYLIYKVTDRMES